MFLLGWQQGFHLSYAQTLKSCIPRIRRGKTETVKVGDEASSVGFQVILHERGIP